MSDLTFPTLVKRLVKGTPLTFTEGDGNLDAIRSFCVSMSSVINGSLNADGTLKSGAVKADSISPGAVGISAIDPTLPYQILPICTDVGTVNAYAVTTAGPVAGSNLVSGSYDGSGNYTLSGLTINSYYYYQKGSADTSLTCGSISITSSQIFQAQQTVATLTGTPSAVITANVKTSPAVTTYTENQIFFVYTNNANTGICTLNVNSLGAIPIQLNGNALVSGVIGARSVFAVVYKAGVFILMSGGGGSGGSSSTPTVSYTLNGITEYNSGNITLPGANATTAVAHQLGQRPTSTQAWLVKSTSDATDSIVAVGEYVPLTSFVGSAGTPNAFTLYDDNTNVSVRQNCAPYLADSSSTFVAITEGSWSLVIKSVKSTAVSSTMQPGLQYAFQQPELGIASGNALAIASSVTDNSTTGLRWYGIDLQSNQVSPITKPSTNSGLTPLKCSGSVFAVQTSTSGLPATYPEKNFIFQSIRGFYYLLAENPSLINLVPAGAVYDAAGTYVLTVVSGVSYKWTKGINDTAYNNNPGSSFPSGSDVTSSGTFTSAGTTIQLKGAVNQAITATLGLGSTTWQPVYLSGYNAGAGGGATYYGYRPVQITASGGSITEVYAVSSNYAISVDVNALIMRKFDSSGNRSVIGTIFDIAKVQNATEFNLFYPTTSTAKVVCFQYNPILKRIYFIGSEALGLIHIINMTGTNDLQTEWAAAVGNNYANFSYLKTVAIGTDGAPWTDVSRCSYTVDFDPVSGAEKAIVITRAGSSITGTVARIAWVG